MFAESTGQRETPGGVARPRSRRGRAVSFLISCFKGLTLLREPDLASSVLSRLGKTKLRFLKLSSWTTMEPLMLSRQIVSVSPVFVVTAVEVKALRQLTLAGARHCQAAALLRAGGGRAAC